MKVFHFVEIDGNRVVRTGSVPAPSMDGYPLMHPGARLELLDEPCGVPLPAYWDQARRVAISLPSRPSPAYEFDYRSLKWVPDVAKAWLEVRAERDRRIAASDWVMLPDVTMTDERRSAWASYRQALRDITSQPDPTKISWPTAPA